MTYKWPYMYVHTHWQRAERSDLTNRCQVSLFIVPEGSMSWVISWLSLNCALSNRRLPPGDVSSMKPKSICTSLPSLTTTPQSRYIFSVLNPLNSLTDPVSFVRVEGLFYPKVNAPQTSYYIVSWGNICRQGGSVLEWYVLSMHPQLEDKAGVANK
jgi:hypothetical protein